MTDKRIRMDCPFCHTPKEQIQLNVISKGVYVLLYCPKCGCVFKGSSCKEVIDKWNCR